MSNGDAVIALIGAIDDLYRDIVNDAAAWDDQEFSLWLEEVALDGPIDRGIARELRRAVRAARKLQRFCVSGHIFAGGDWRSVVDQALGSRAWLPSLEMAKGALEAAPTEELFAEVKHRFPVVHFTPWMEGVEYDEWLATHPGTDA